MVEFLSMHSHYKEQEMDKNKPILDYPLFFPPFFGITLKKSKQIFIK